MSRNCRFAVAIHITALLSIEAGQGPVTSDWIAKSVNTNPVVVRRIIGALVKAGLVRSVRGSAGGAVLAKSANSITLQDIASAVEEDSSPALHNQPPNPACPVGRTIQPVLQTILDRAEDARAQILSATRLSEVVADILAHA